MKNKVSRFAIFAERVHLLNCGAKSFRASAPTQEAAKELVEKFAKSKKALHYSWLQILDMATGKFTEYSIKRGGV